MAMARRRQSRVQAIDIATAQGVDPKKFDWERFINMGDTKPKYIEPHELPPAVRYEIERIIRNGGHYVAPEDQLRFDSERAENN